MVVSSSASPQNVDGPGVSLAKGSSATENEHLQIHLLEAKNGSVFSVCASSPCSSPSLRPPPLASAGNNIGYLGARALADSLRVNTTLEGLELDGLHRNRRETKEEGEALGWKAETFFLILNQIFLPKQRGTHSILSCAVLSLWVVPSPGFTLGKPSLLP